MRCGIIDHLMKGKRAEAMMTSYGGEVGGICAQCLVIILSHIYLQQNNYCRQKRCSAADLLQTSDFFCNKVRKKDQFFWKGRV